MNRRDFIRGMTAVAGILTATLASAQTPSPETVENARNRLTDTFARRIELEQIPEDSIEWIEGISDGSHCSFE